MAVAADVTAERPSRPSEEALSAYESRWSKWLLIVSVVYLFVVLYEMLPGVRIGAALWVIDFCIWLVFLADYTWRVLFLAPNRRRYARTPLCVLDAVVVAAFPITVVLAFLPTSFNGVLLGGVARLLRVAAQLLRFGRVGVQGAKAVGQAHRVFTRRTLYWVAPLALLFTTYAAIFVWMAEKPHNDANIRGLSDAGWWALVTLETVGYGDVYPHTASGRIMAVLLMLVGVAFFGLITAALASVFVENDDSSLDVRKLERLAAKHEQGRLTDEQFAAKKGKVIGQSKLERLIALHEKGSLTDEEFTALKVDTIG